MIQKNQSFVHYVLVLLLIFNFKVFAEVDEFNMSFEQIEEGSAVGWKDFGTAEYQIATDDQIKQHGQYSAMIESLSGENAAIKDNQFKAWSYEIPARYQGEKIKLTGHIKTENVASGYAGLWLRIDPRLAFDNMSDRGVVGTNDWQQYEIELDFQARSATKIVFGGLLTGTGKMWIDNLSLSIDGLPIGEVPLKELTPAEKDTEFDNGSNITIKSPSEETLLNLTVLGKVWGFLKYHHPAIAQSKYNWDYELFRFLPKYLAVKNKEQRDQLLMGWVDALGTINACEPCETTQFDAFLKPDFRWLNHGISSALKEKLKFVYENRNQGPHHYVNFGMAGNAEFANESPYSLMPYPDGGFRLLAVYRYWNMIQYYFPYKHLTTNDWDTVLKTYIPQFLAAKDELEYELITTALIAEVQDSHATLLPPGANKITATKGKLYPPVHVRFVDEKLVVDDYYNPEMQKEVGLKLGDVITHINEKVVGEIIKEKTKEYPASNWNGYLRNLSMDILRSDEEELELKVLRKKKSLKKTIPMYEMADLNYYYWYPAEPEGKSYKFLPNNIGYITLKNIKEEDIEAIKAEFSDTKGIIIDIRNYPSTFVPYKLGSFFTSVNTPFSSFTMPRPNNPGEYVFIDPISIPKGEKTYQNPLVVLVNEITQSQAEFTTMAFQAGVNTTVIGSTTAGADGNISKINLPGGLSSYISGLGVFYPDGTETQQIGVKIDHIVKPTVAGIRAGRDELLEKAIELIESKSP